MTAPGDPQDQLIRQLVAKWNTLAATTFAGIRGPYRDEAPSNVTAHPYCVIKDASGGADSIGSTCKSEQYESQVEFRVYAKTPEEAATQVAKIDGVFSSQSLSLVDNGISVIGVRLMRPAYVKADEAVAYGGLTYRFQLSRLKIA